LANAPPPRTIDQPEGRILIFDSATFIEGHMASHAGDAGAVVVAASFAGVLCARMVMSAKPRAAIGLDCAIGMDGAGIAGLWFYEALAIPAAAADVMTAEMGNGEDLYENGVISRVNDCAQQLGLAPEMTVKDAIAEILTGALRPLRFDPARRLVVETAPSGRSIVCTDSIAFALPEDRQHNVLCTAGHTGRSVLEYFRRFRPWGYICSDGGIGKNRSGLSALEPSAKDGIPGACVDARTARMGDGQSTYFDGIISAMNSLAEAKGVKVGQPARDAARLMLD
jgi:hypothetical protein